MAGGHNRHAENPGSSWPNLPCSRLYEERYPLGHAHLHRTRPAEPLPRASGESCWRRARGELAPAQICTRSRAVVHLWRVVKLFVDSAEGVDRWGGENFSPKKEDRGGSTISAGGTLCAIKAGMLPLPTLARRFVRLNTGRLGESAPWCGVRVH